MRIPDHLEGDAGGKVALLDLTYAELEDLALSLGQPRYRAAQIAAWVYKHLASDFKEMHNLPLALRERLAEVSEIGRLTPLEEITSQDGLTRKVLFSLPDGHTIESVLLHYKRRHTICLSTQVGCSIGCPFCATGQAGFERDLSPGEIVEQVLYFARELQGTGQRLTNLVFMGMGEPFLNWEATWKAVQAFTDPRRFGLGARHITISTAGFVPGIEALAREESQLGLAISLHAANDELRERLVPLNRRYPLEVLMEACRDYVKRTGRRVTFEYALIEGLNDSPSHAQELAGLLSGLLCHVNLIPLNPIADCAWRGSPKDAVLAFQRELRKEGVPVTVRMDRGLDIQAGCGQLRSRRGTCQAK
ncbi:MAG TPA: 23S rRNA (adenine(2503)-C(2))-methyltransferase RlmN [Chloroflexi bacterium]|nr:23S rRNA (adenine(2503)-C(2))-methyltransferase RlmN [Chloroflexota bacterium]